MNEINQLQEIIDNSEKIVFFGGAGVSTESGIPDFRSSDGLYSIKLDRHFTPEQLISHTMYLKYPEEFYYLAELENNGKLAAVITQNIDSLHEMAGSKKVLKLHGSVDKNTCTECGKKYNLEDFLKLCNDIPHCTECNGIIKPDVTLYEESLDMTVFNEAIYYISQADTLIIGGTSLVVYPAASLVQYFKGDNLVLINKSSTLQDNYANLVIHDSIGKVFGQLK